jgi:NhaP-type Na+/H+ or K+/H+ antiporter
MNPYYLIVTISVFIILSYLFGEFSKRTNIPSVLLLIFTGVGLGLLLPYLGIETFNYNPMLKILGIVGLIMIVLEGALDLQLTKEKMGMIGKAVILALLGIGVSIAGITVALTLFFKMETGIAALYASTLSVISSAIVLPSVSNLAEKEKEFLVYESCISDIVGIMVFTLIEAILISGNLGTSVAEFSFNVVITIVISFLVSVALIFMFKFLTGQTKLFLFIAILVLIYALGKLMGLSSLLLILVFGLVLKNHELVFRGRLKGIISRMEFRLMERNFHIITRETAFVLRTFFFLVFGLSIDLGSMFDVKVLIISAVLVFFIFISRWLMSGMMLKQFDNVVKYIAPRGLITILLYYKIPEELKSPAFEDGLLLWVIVLTSLILTVGLVRYKVPVESKQ